MWNQLNKFSYLREGFSKLLWQSMVTYRRFQKFVREMSCNIRFDFPNSLDEGDSKLLWQSMVTYYLRLFPDAKVLANYSIKSLPPIHQVPQAEQMILMAKPQLRPEWIHKIDLETYYVRKITIHYAIYTYTYISIYIYIYIYI